MRFGEVSRLRRWGRVVEAVFLVMMISKAINDIMSSGCMIIRVSNVVQLVW